MSTLLYKIDIFQKEWFADSTYCWKGYPYHYLSSGIFWYYQIEMSFYWSLLFSQFFDIKRKGAKCAKYAGFQKICDAGFAIMGIVWFVTRLVIYPLKVLKTSWFECKSIVGIYPSLYVFNAMLLVLLILHVYWFKLIVIVAYRAICKSDEVSQYPTNNNPQYTLTSRYDVVGQLGEIESNKPSYLFQHLN
ncbi:CERS5_6 [Mytilus coruscus]|uniref:CERS5_6 n=1 Tax=Mytilus coruscus TaxID=42192 RepID=A0A6J8EQ00_MYTCO|nr:CERS5_6 [Mytilus coruscus]